MRILIAILLFTQIVSGAYKPGAISNPMTTTGDMIYSSNSSGNPARVAIGSSGQALTVSGGIPTWATISGGINYLSANPSAESDTTGWATYADAAQSTPENCTAGSPNSTWTRSTSSPLRGAGSFIFTKNSGASRQGEGASYAFTTDSADAAKPLEISFDMSLVSGTWSGSVTPGTNSDLTIWVYDVTTGALIAVAGNLLDPMVTGSTYKYRGVFQTHSSSTSYRLCIHSANTTNSAFVTMFDNFKVGPQVVSNGAVVSDWTSFTASWTGTTSNPTVGTTVVNYAKWRRIGDSMEIQYNLETSAAGSAGSGSYLFELPSGYSIDSTKATITPTTAGTATNLTSGTETVGFGTAANQAVGGTNFADHISVSIYSSTKLAFQGNTNPAALQRYPLGNNSAANFGSSKLYMTFTAIVPISGWSSNVQMANDTDTRVVVLEAYKSSTTSGLNNTDATVTFDTVVKDTHSSLSGSTYTVPVSGQYFVSATLGFGGFDATIRYYRSRILKNGSQVKENYMYFSSTYNSTDGTIPVADIVDVRAGDTITITGGSSNTNFSITGNGSLLWSKLSIMRISGPSQVAATEQIVASYTATSATSLSNGSATVIDFNTKNIDSHGIVSGSGATWKATFPIAGTYEICFQILTAETTWPGTQYSMYTDFYKNGATQTVVVMQEVASTSLHNVTNAACYMAKYIAGDYIALRATQNSGGALNTDTSFSKSWVTIKKVGNY